MEDLPDDDVLGAVQRIVGGWVEETSSHDPSITVLCNEEGLLKRLPYNPRAVMLLGRDLVGDVVVLGVSDYDWTDIPPAALNRMDLWPFPGETTGEKEKES